MSDIEILKIDCEMNSIQRFSEKVFVVISLVLFTGAIEGFIADDNPLTVVRDICIYAGHIITLILIVIRWKKVIPIVIKEKLLWAIVAITLASSIWSDMPMVTLGNTMPLLRVTIFAIYFAAVFSFQEQLRLLSWAFGVSALLSLIVCLVIPQYGVVGVGLIVGQEEVVHTGSWRGLYNHKTFLGSIMSVGSLILLFCGIGKLAPKYHSIIWAGYFLSIFMILRSTTLAALAILIFTTLLIPLCQLERKNFNLFISIVSSLVVFGSFLITAVISNSESLFGYFGKDATISGRTLIWPLLLDKIWQRPWLGYGYETFWKDGWHGEVGDVWRSLINGFQPPHAHNGLLELWLDIGFIGLAIFILNFLVVCTRALVWLHKNRTIEGVVPIVLIIHMFLLSLTESYLMRGDIYWLIYVSLTLSMYKKVSKVYLIYQNESDYLGHHNYVN